MVDEEYDDDDYEYEDYIPFEDEMYDSYKTSTVGRIDPNDRTITVVVKNDSDADKEAIVFGGNESPAVPDGVSITVEESSHKEVQEESKSNPFKISGMKMSVSDELQFDHVLSITRKTATGSKTARVYQPRNATSPQNFSGKQIDDSSFEMDVTGQDSLRFTIRSKATAVFTFTIKARANMGNILKGSNVAELSRAPRTTGLPQIDLMRQRRRRRPPTARPVRRRPVRGYIRSGRKKKRPSLNRLRSKARFAVRRRPRG